MKQKDFICSGCGKHSQLRWGQSHHHTKKYCSTTCQKKTAYKSRLARYKARYVPVQRDCAVCKRDIHSVGERKQANKYCSQKCMFIAQYTREGQKYVIVKIPVEKVPELYENEAFRDMILWDREERKGDTLSL